MKFDNSRGYIVDRRRFLDSLTVAWNHADDGGRTFPKGDKLVSRIRRRTMTGRITGGCMGAVAYTGRSSVYTHWGKVEREERDSQVDIH